MTFSKRQNYFACRGDGWRRWTLKGHEGTFWEMEEPCPECGANTQHIPRVQNWRTLPVCNHTAGSLTIKKLSAKESVLSTVVLEKTRDSHGLQGDPTSHS